MVVRRDVLIGGAVLAAASVSSVSAFGQEGPKRASVSSTLGKTALQSYRRGVQVMKARSVLDPTSWWYQGLIHGMLNGMSKEDLIDIASLQMSPVAKDIAEAAWDTCPHGSDDFPAWHRLYLHYFEKIVAAASGDPDFRLPYWDYSENDASRVLPVEFREPVGGSLMNNALFNNARDPFVNGLSNVPVALEGTDVALDALTEPFFGERPPLPRAGFRRAVERTPHDLVHGAIGGGDQVVGLIMPSGDMSSTLTAGRDPIFWLHHSNIDRLWESWLQRGGETLAGNYSEESWFTQVWTFADADGSRVDMSLAQLGSAATPSYEALVEIDRDPTPEGGFFIIPVTQETVSLGVDGLSVTVPQTALPESAVSTVRVELRDVVSVPNVIATIDVFLDGHDGQTWHAGAFNFFSAGQMDHAGHQAQPKSHLLTVRDFSGSLQDLKVRLEPRRATLLPGTITIGSISLYIE